jgi:transcriptional regulator with XRE-family HTH domain
MGRKTSRLPSIAVRRALRQLGNDLRNARRRRRIPMALMAERVGVTRMTLAKAERGDGSVSMGIYASMLFVLGLIDRLTQLGSLQNDDVGIALEEEQLPQRIHLKRPKAVP